MTFMVLMVRRIEGEMVKEEEEEEEEEEGWRGCPRRRRTGPL